MSMEKGYYLRKIKRFKEENIMKLKKILPLALAISLMVGCSGKKQSSAPTNEEIVIARETVNAIK